MGGWVGGCVGVSGLVDARVGGWVGGCQKAKPAGVWEMRRWADVRVGGWVGVWEGGQGAGQQAYGQHRDRQTGEQVGGVQAVVVQAMLRERREDWWQLRKC